MSVVSVADSLFFIDLILNNARASREPKHGDLRRIPTGIFPESDEKLIPVPLTKDSYLLVPISEQIVSFSSSVFVNLLNRQKYRVHIENHLTNIIEFRSL